jgi:Fe-S-cluster containining protein
MIAGKDLTLAIKMVNPLFDELQNLYGYLPKTQCRCRKPGVCCAYIPQMTLLEALQWIRIIQEMPDTAKTDILKKFMTYYLTNPVHHTGCPFLQNNVCSNYTCRSFACRAYGMWSRRIGDNRTHKNRLERNALLDTWRRFGLNLPPEMVAYEIDYCDQVHCLSQPTLSDDQLVAILQKIYRLDRNLPELQQKFEEEYHSDFSFLITSLVLSPKKAVLGKYAVIKEMVKQKTSNRLNTILAKVTPEVAGISIP